MTERRSRFVLLCQQALACAVVVAVAAPATGVVTLDIVAPPASAPAPTAAAGPARQAGSLVASEPVEPVVTAVPITGRDGRLGNRTRPAQPSSTGATGGGSFVARTVADDGGTAQDDPTSAVTPPQPVDGFATVGVTWDRSDRLEDDQITVSVRTQQDGAWSRWQEVPYDADHGPDAGSPEAKHSRNGTDALVIGDVDDVQVKAVTSDGATLPSNMSLDIVDPGKTNDPVREQPAIDTARLASASTPVTSTGDPVTDPSQPADPTDPSDPVDPSDPAAELVGKPADVTPKPQIFSRAQWGADERMRDKSSLRYFEVHAGFVHHTVNTNGYTQAQVPSIIRGIYAYHTQSRGWSDIGYNYLVDRFGRIWEGRYGGVDRPVVGAHTLGYNEYAFAMSAIGNYDTTQPSSAMVEAYGRLFAWKLSLHGVSAGSTKQWVGKKYLPAINGHRDVGQTACPGRYLYAKVPTIRSLAAKYQRPFTSRTRSTNLAGTRYPDVVVREKGTNRALVVRTGGQVGFANAVKAASGWAGMDLVIPIGDLNRDGRVDVLGRDARTKAVGFYPGDGRGHFGARAFSMTRFATLDQLFAVGDLNGDGYPDMVGRRASDKSLKFYPGQRNGRFGTTRALASGWGSYVSTTGAGDFNGDGKRDLIARDAGGRLWLVPGTGRIALGKPVALPGSFADFDVVTGGDDVTNDGIPDLLVRHRKSQQVYVYPGNGRGGFATRIGPLGNMKNLASLSVVGKAMGTKSNDLVGRASNGNLVVLANRGGKAVEATTNTGTTFPDTNLILNVGDWDGDSYGDIMTRQTSTGNVLLRRGLGNGKFAAPVVAAKGWGSVDLLAAVGDMTGDGYPDLMGQPRGGAMRIYPGNGGTGFRAGYVAHGAITATSQLGVGRWDADGSPDTLVRKSDGSLSVFAGNGPGGLTGSKAVPGGTSGYDWVLSLGDLDGDGRPDLLVRAKASGWLWLLPGTGSGFGTRRFVAAGFDKYDLAG